VPENGGRLGYWPSRSVNCDAVSCSMRTGGSPALGVYVRYIACSDRGRERKLGTSGVAPKKRVLGEIEPIERHDFAPRLDEVLDELGFAVFSTIDLCDGPKPRV